MRSEKSKSPVRIDRGAWKTKKKIDTQQQFVDLFPPESRCIQIRPVDVSRWPIKKVEHGRPWTVVSVASARCVYGSRRNHRTWICVYVYVCVCVCACNVTYVGDGWWQVWRGANAKRSGEVVVWVVKLADSKGVRGQTRCCRYRARSSIMSDVRCTRRPLCN